jgi:hypothetical protein
MATALVKLPRPDLPPAMPQSLDLEALELTDEHLAGKSAAEKRKQEATLKERQSAITFFFHHMKLATFARKGLVSWGR